MLALTLADFNFIGTANAQAAGGMGAITQFLPFVLIFIIMYVLMIRPQNKKAKEHREMVSALKKGDRVVISNGLLGGVSKILDDHEISVEIAPDVNVTVMRASVSQVISKTTKAPTTAPSGKSAGKPVKKTTALKKKAATKKAPKK